MDENSTRALHAAYSLIKQGKKQEAQAILIQVVRSNPEIPEAWALLGMALDDVQKKTYSFQQVLRLDPSNKIARQQLDQLKEIPNSTSPHPVPQPQGSGTRGQEPISDTPKQTAARIHSPRKKFPALEIGISGGLAVLLGAAVFTGWWIYSTLALPAVPTIEIPENSLPAVSPASTEKPATPAFAPTPSPDFIPVFQGSICPFDIPLGTRVRCGVVSVPQDRSKNFSDQIELPVVLYQSSKPDADVVFFLQGGPGVESIDWSTELFDVFVNPLLQDFDMVFFDPRGTGRADPVLDCPELNTIFLDAYFQNRSETEAFKDFTNAWSSCRERYLADGVDPAAYNTTQSAADVRDIALALGYDKVNLLGISYGTRLGLTIMRDYPDLVRAAVLDSVVPMQARMYNRRSMDVQYALDKVFEDCAASQRCNKDYPELAKVFYDLIERFDRQPVSIKAYDPFSGFVYDIKVNGVDMLSAFAWGLHTSELVPVIPKAIYDIQKGDNTFLSFALGVPAGEYNSMGLGTYYSTVCPEQVYATTAEEMEADLKSTSTFEEFALAPFFGSAERVFEICNAWGANPHIAQDSLPVTAEVPTLIISGEYDPTTPVTTGQMVAEDLPNDFFYTIPGMGHGATVGNACSLSIVIEFLADPSREPENSCLQDLQGFEFFLPYDGVRPIDLIPVNEYVVQIKGAVPAGWKKRLSSYTYHREAYLFDPTLVGFDSFAASEPVVIAALTEGFEESGFDTTPIKIGDYSANGLAWKIYRTQWNGEPVMLALAELTPRRTLALFMVVSAPEQQAFYKGLFLPMLDELVPLN
jgi:pimeloyl-ACP methyl ester carboxylesterase